MTLDPVFRSRKAVEQIKKDGFIKRMSDSIAAQHRAIAYINGILPEVLDSSYIADEPEQSELEFLQHHFFLILFHSIFKTLGASEQHLEFYARLNLCIKGIVTAGDNLFDDEAKLLIPLKLGKGRTFASILQMLCFDRLIHRVCDDAVAEGWLSVNAARNIHRGLLNRLAEIGALEGSEEEGVREILTSEETIERVHRVRGGALFSLAFIAPSVIETGETLERFRKAETAVRRLGTAFQIVDDLTDFEFDLTRRSHNLLFSEAYHNGTPEMRQAIESLLSGAKPEPRMVETVFRDCARRVLDRAREEGRKAFEELARLGFWYPPEKSDDLVHAIVGLEGVARMESLTS